MNFLIQFSSRIPLLHSLITTSDFQQLKHNSDHTHTKKPSKQYASKTHPSMHIGISREQQTSTLLRPSADRYHGILPPAPTVGEGLRGGSPATVGPGGAAPARGRRPPHVPQVTGGGRRAHTTKARCLLRPPCYGITPTHDNGRVNV